MDDREVSYVFTTVEIVTDCMNLWSIYIKLSVTGYWSW